MKEVFWHTNVGRLCVQPDMVVVHPLNVLNTAQIGQQAQHG